MGNGMGLIGVVAGLIIGAAIFIYVATTLLASLKDSYAAGAGTLSADTEANVTGPFNTSVDGMITVSFTVGTLMAVAAIAVVGFWVVKNVIGGQ